MPAAVQQLSLPFACLDFTSRGAVAVWEIADKLGCSSNHICNLIDDGTIEAFDLTRHVGSRRMIRVTVEEYRRYVLTKLSGAKRREFIAELPLATKREIARELLAQLPADTTRELIGEFARALAA